jgi:hypothetical protein
MCDIQIKIDKNKGCINRATNLLDARSRLKVSTPFAKAFLEDYIERMIFEQKRLTNILYHNRV